MTSRVSECCSCERVRPVLKRGLCRACYVSHFRRGTLAEYGYVKADRTADYARLRSGGVSVLEAAARLGVSERTARRYEAELVAAGAAPWRQWVRVA